MQEKVLMGSLEVTYVWALIFLEKALKWLRIKKHQYFIEQQNLINLMTQTTYYMHSHCETSSQ